MAKKTTAPTPTPEQPPPGRPEWKPDDRTLGQIEGWAESGAFTNAQMADRLGIDVQTLTKHCKAQLTFGRMDKLAVVARNAYRFAMGAPAQFDENNNQVRAEVVPQAWAICFILKTQAGWSEKPKQPGLPPPGDIDWSLYSEAELELIARAQQLIDRNAAPAAASSGGDRSTTH